MLRINKIFNFSRIIIFVMIFNFNSNAFAIVDHRIAVLVNDQIITSYDITQRMKINAILQGINITTENNNQLANIVVDELIKEKLKSEKLTEYDITVSNEEYLLQEGIFFKNKPYNKKEILEIFEENNINYSSLQNQLTNEMSWSKLISGIYYRLTSASEIEIEEVMQKNPGITEEKARDLIIQKQLDLKSSKLIRDLLNEATIEYK